MGHPLNVGYKPRANRHKNTTATGLDTLSASFHTGLDQLFARGDEMSIRRTIRPTSMTRLVRDASNTNNDLAQQVTKLTTSSSSERLTT